MCFVFPVFTSKPTSLLASNRAYGLINEERTGKAIEGSGCGLILRCYPGICLEY
jgi:hypothetical protein